MKPTLQLKLGQSLTMTPQLQQAIRLLQLSAVDLQQEVQTVLESNPLLEMVEHTTENSDQPKGEATDNEPPSLSEGMLDLSRSAVTPDDTILHSQDQVHMSVDLSNSADIPTDLPDDSGWDDTFQNTTPATSLTLPANGDKFESRDSASETLYDKLLWQLNLTPMSDIDRMTGLAIIEAIDNKGYLTLSLEDTRDTILAQNDVIADILNDKQQQYLNSGINDPSEPEDPLTGPPEFNISIEEIKAVLHLIQQFDPPGVGAGNLRECLSIQLNQLPGDTPWVDQAKLIVGEHLEALGSKDFPVIMRKTRLSENNLKEVIRLIQSLNPCPGLAVEPDSTQYIIPDVIVTKKNGRWKVELNLDNAPNLRINAGYASLVRRADNSSDNTFLRNNLQEARWFIKSLKSRNETLLKVAIRIVEHQISFFENGEESMKPLVLQEIAAVEMHESTISRITTQKYMRTPHGLFELKYFFSSHVSTTSGGECSSTAIRAIIKKFISAENPGKPLSDNKIATMLKEQGVKVARRTIAKYREALSIPPSNERKRLV